MEQIIFIEEIKKSWTSCSHLFLVYVKGNISLNEAHKKLINIYGSKNVSYYWNNVFLVMKK